MSRYDDSSNDPHYKMLSRYKVPRLMQRETSNEEALFAFAS